MNEQEWKTSGDPHEMLYWLIRRARKDLVRTGAGRRKLRLFGCFSCRILWEQMKDPRSRAAVEVAERLADGLAGKADQEHARARAWEAVRAVQSRRVVLDEDEEARLLARGWLPDDAETAASAAVKVLASQAGNFAWAGLGYSYGEALPEYPVYQRRRRREADAVRCLFGNPFRPVTLDPAWLTPDVVKLAQAAYEERTLPAGTLEPARLLLLADALEDAGCTNSDILGHRRSERPHVRGCWAVDRVLGKE
jgi:hypothetical protein